MKLFDSQAGLVLCSLMQYNFVFCTAPEVAFDVISGAPIEQFGLDAHV